VAKLESSSGVQGVTSSWLVSQEGSSHITLEKPGYSNFTWAFHDNVEIGPKMLARIAKHTGLKPTDL
jgi:predicted RNA binding protein YcfA (HicA-like mRNA interferase family)